MMKTLRKSTFCVGAALVLAGSTLAMAGSHTWDVFEVFSDCTGKIQFIELREMNGTAGETGVNGHNITSTTRSFLVPGGPLVAPTTNKHLLFATPGFVGLPGAPTPDYVIPANLVPFVTVGGPDTIAYTPWDTMIIGAGALPTNGINSFNEGVGSAPNSPRNYAGATGSINLSCALKGDIDGNAVRDGLDIAGFVRVVTGVPIVGDNVFCAEYCTGSIAGNVTAFVNDLML